MANKTSNPEFRKFVYSKCDGKCAYCGLNIDFNEFHIDHVTPKRRYSYSYSEYMELEKGSDELYNLLPSCKACNTCKKDLTLEGFRERIEKRVQRLNDYSTEYQIAKKYGLVIEIPKSIIFYFETLNNAKN